MIAFISLGFGSILAAFHPVWSGAGLVVTLLGWAQVAKGAAYFCFPEWGLRRMSVLDPERPWMMRAAGGMLLLLAAIVARHLAQTA